MRLIFWRVYLAAGIAIVGGYLFVPDGVPQDLVYALLGGSSLAAIAVGIRLHNPARQLPWWLMFAGLLLWVAGDALSSWYEDIAHDAAYPSWADACYLAAYPVIAAGLLILIRGRLPRRDIAGLLDSATVTAGLGLLSWVLIARPTLSASEHTPAAAIVGVAYPMADILLASMLIRLVTTPGGRTPAFRWLFGAVSLLIAGDTLSAALSLWSTSSTSAFELIWLASYVAWGTAALHPSMARLSDRSHGNGVDFSRWRLAALGVAILIAPGTLAVQSLAHVTIDVWAVVTGSVVLFLLVVARMHIGIRQVVTANRERARAQHDLVYQAAHDALTGLPNRADALHQIEAALSRAQRTGGLLGLLFVDLDGFKSVNDSFGHRGGDEVLRVVGGRLSDLVRGGDLVARLGGDEFVVLLECLDSETTALHVALRLIETISAPIRLPLAGDHVVSVGASVGIAISVDGSTDAGRFLHEADTAVYRAKKAGRGRVEIFDDVLRHELAERAELEAALRVAIEQEQLMVQYQPIVELATGGVSGYEALVRWQRPLQGLLPPSAFIPTAEASNLVCDLDAWVLRHATAQLARWTESGGPRRTVAVNISGRHIGEPRVVDDVRAALAESGLDARQLVLEITETVLTEDMRAVDHLQQLRALGVAISIDDFGTGYSSIARLQHLPVDVIKIDHSFLDQQPSSRALLELMVHAAHAFGLPVVAEGVETVEQLEMVRAMSCEFIQGFHVARPLTAEQIGRLDLNFAAAS